MHSRYLRKGGPWWLLLCLAALWLIWSAAAAQTAANRDTVLPTGMGAQSPPRELAGARSAEDFAATLQHQLKRAKADQ